MPHILIGADLESSFIQGVARSAHQCSDLSIGRVGDAIPGFFDLHNRRLLVGQQPAGLVRRANHADAGGKRDDDRGTDRQRPAESPAAFQTTRPQCSSAKPVNADCTEREYDHGRDDNAPINGDARDHAEQESRPADQQRPGRIDRPTGHKHERADDHRDQGHAFHVCFSFASRGASVEAATSAAPWPANCRASSFANRINAFRERSDPRSRRHPEWPRHGGLPD